MSSMTFLDSTGATKYVLGEGAGTELDPIAFTKITKHRIVATDEIVMDYMQNGSSRDMTVDGSSTPVTFTQTVTVPTGSVFRIARRMMFLEDSTNFTSTTFAGITALTNGVDLAVEGEVIFNIKTNLDLAIAAFDSNGQKNLGKEQQTMLVRLSFDKFLSDSGLSLLEGEEFQIIVNDDLTGLDIFNIMIEGYLHEL